MTDDDLIRSAFSEAKADDLRDVPSFDSVVARRTSRGVWSSASPAVRLAAAGLLIAAAVTMYATMKTRERRFTVPSEVVALGAWRPATDALLAMPTDLLRAAPVLGTSILDPIAGRDTASTGAFR